MPGQIDAALASFLGRAKPASPGGSQSSAPVVPQVVAKPSAVQVDLSASPLDTLRMLLAQTIGSINELPVDSPRLNPARLQARQIATAIAQLERLEGQKETAEQAKDRERKANAETRKMLLQYVEQAEKEAELLGVCAHCGQRKAEGGA